MRLVVLTVVCSLLFSFFFFNDTATTEIYTLSLHDALPIFVAPHVHLRAARLVEQVQKGRPAHPAQRGHAPGDPHGLVFQDRKSTRLNSSHANISYAVFCLKKKKKT